MGASSSALGGGGRFKTKRAQPTLGLLKRCSWRAECLLQARGHLPTRLWLAENPHGEREHPRPACSDAPLEATDSEVLDILANEMGADFRRDGVVRFAVAYAATAHIFITTLARDPRRLQCDVVAIEAHDFETHLRAHREIIRSPGRVPVLGALSAIESAHDSRYARLLACVTA